MLLLVLTLLSPLDISNCHLSLHACPCFVLLHRCLTLAPLSPFCSVLSHSPPFHICAPRDRMSALAAGLSHQSSERSSLGGLGQQMSGVVTGSLSTQGQAGTGSGPQVSFDS